MKKNVFMIAALACAAQVNAAEPVDTAKTVMLQDVQVTSTRADKRTPVAFTNITKADISKLNIGHDLPMLLSFTPSVTTTSDAGNGIGYTSIRVRGVDPSRINITANGIPMNDAESSQVFFVNMGDFASSVQSMQIQRGAGTSTNGSGAFGASINMQTENIGVNPFVGIDMSAGSYYTHKETMRFGTGLINGHWGVQGRLSNIGSHGYIDRAHTNLNSYFIQAGYFGDKTMVKFITFNGKEQTYHAWNYASKYEQSLYGRRYNSCGEYYDNDGNVHYYDDQTDNYHQQNYQLIWNQIINPQLSFNIAMHYTKGQGYYEEYKSNKNLQDYGLSDLKFKTDLVRQKKVDNDFYGAVASLIYQPADNMKLTWGGGWNKYDGDHFGLVTWVKEPQKEFYPNFEYYRNTAWKTDLNTYVKAEREWFEGFSTFVDLQFRHVGYRMEDPANWYIGGTANGLWAHDDFDFFNPKVGVHYDICRNHSVYASYAMSHREPVRNDYQDNYTQHLKAEKLQDIEVGYRYSSPTFAAGINFYYMFYNNQYVLTGQLNEIGEMIASNDNSGESYRTGIELDASWKPVNWFRWDINAAFSKNRNKNWTISWTETNAQGDEVEKGANLGETHTSFSPEAIINNIFTFSYKGASATIRSRYVGEQYLTNTDFKYYVNYNEDGSVDRNVGMMLEDFFTTDINLAYNFKLNAIGLKDATIGVTFYNIFNKKYDNNGWAAPNYGMKNGKLTAYCVDDLYEAGFAPSAPFNWMANLSINF
ncbi:MAG: TonB-dependent receptor [Prevotella sp.]|nr:TonB-dependent receptor [Prevotella sp.]